MERQCAARVARRLFGCGTTCQNTPWLQRDLAEHLLVAALVARAAAWLQAEMELTNADEHGKITQELTLRAMHHRVRSTKPITGHLRVKTWLGSTHEALGRMHSGLFIHAHKSAS